MKRFLWALALLLSFCLAFTGCGKTPDASTDKEQTNDTFDIQAADVEAAEPLSDFENAARTPTGDFAIQTALGGKVTQTKGGYEIAGGGTYTLTGALHGTLTVRAGDEESVTLVLNGAAITSDSDSAICIESANKALITAQEGSYNLLCDKRDAGQTDAKSHDGALFAACDLSLAGKGVLIVETNSDNGVKTKDDLNIQDLSLKVTSPGNALKGNDSVTVESGNLILISTAADGIKTENSDLSSKGNQRGNISLNGGHTDLYTAQDGVSAAYDLHIGAGGTILNVFTASFAKEKMSSAPFSLAAESDVSSKGLKAENAIEIAGGVIGISAGDDAIHANASDASENGTSGVGNITVTGGALILASADDAIHADGELVISGGAVRITQSREGLEANVVHLAGGNVSVVAADDGVNAVQGKASPLIHVSGGRTEITTSAGDTDAIDSNGAFTMSGGVLLVKGGAATGGMAGSVDADGDITVTGGTLLAFGGICKLPAQGSVNTYVSANTSFAAGDYLLADEDGGKICTFTLDGSFRSVWIASEKFVLNGSYRLSANGAQILSWTQSDATVGAVGGMDGMGRGGMSPGGENAPVPAPPGGDNRQAPGGENTPMPTPPGGVDQNSKMKKGGAAYAPSDPAVAV